MIVLQWNFQEFFCKPISLSNSVKRLSLQVAEIDVHIIYISIQRLFTVSSRSRDIRISLYTSRQFCFQSFAGDNFRFDCKLSEHFLHLLVGNDRIVLLEEAFLLKMVVKRAVMSFSVSVLRAVNVTTFAFCLDESDFAAAFPALWLVNLYFGCFFFLLFLLLFILHLDISFYNWLRVDYWLLRFLWLFCGCDNWLFRELRLGRDSFCNFFYEFLDWWSFYCFFCLLSLLLFEAFRAEKVCILGSVEGFTVVAKSHLVAVVLLFHVYSSLLFGCRAQVLGYELLVF